MISYGSDFGLAIGSAVPPVPCDEDPVHGPAFVAMQPSLDILRSQRLAYITRSEKLYSHLDSIYSFSDHHEFKHRLVDR